MRWISAPRCFWFDGERSFCSSVSVSRPLQRSSEKKRSFEGRSSWSQAQNVSHDVRNTRHRTARADTREPVAPRRATVTDVSNSRDGTHEIAQRDGAMMARMNGRWPTRRADETWSETRTTAQRTSARRPLHEWRRRQPNASGGGGGSGVTRTATETAER